MIKNILIIAGVLFLIDLLFGTEIFSSLMGLGMTFIIFAVAIAIAIKVIKACFN